ncbi:50S ribosomal protein L4 [Oleiagrimonas soli]|uniref:Large ribosomal subunit protein uL4 n=1 Tax=Oleiagrimonas soli TaxID=1543381 RepID=A0A099CWK3_9GAMM|nr:50S ribosomal protein L4 [Oleiagrimonas soli]KGI77405.1 50S ribosomal protein L4 [Oleiagrimonas soli]MBB6182659.1 large subunit ribosomal protein L4 [Oleiagrimonas soli]
MELNVTGAKPMKVSEVVFGAEFREHLIHQVVVAYQAGGRSGTKAQKTRSEVNGTTKKSKRQKGGGARHGALTAPIFVGGGVTFAAKPRSFEQKVNRKMYRGALRSIVAELNRQERFKVVEDFGLESAKTKAMAAKLAELDVSGRVLLVSESATEDLYMAARNIPYVHVVDVAALNPVSLVGADYVVATVESVKKLEEWLA